MQRSISVKFQFIFPCWLIKCILANQISSMRKCLFKTSCIFKLFFLLILHTHTSWVWVLGQIYELQISSSRMCLVHYLNGNLRWRAVLNFNEVWKQTYQSFLWSMLSKSFSGNLCLLCSWVCSPVLLVWAGPWLIPETLHLWQGFPFDLALFHTAFMLWYQVLTKITLWIQFQ